MLNAIYILDAERREMIYGPDEQAAIGRLVNVYAPAQTRTSITENMALLAPADIILTGWGAPTMDEAFLAAAPRLRAVFYGAGSIKSMVTEAFWQRNIAVTSAWAANAIPTAEFAFSQIIFCLKRGWHYALSIKRLGAYPPREYVPGAYGSTVGIVSLGTVGRHVCKLLQNLDVKIVAYDPYINKETATALKVELCSLADVFRRSDVVSLHTPWLKETEGMITGQLIASMKPYATLINTSRGAIVREAEMIEVLQQRPDLWAILDVTYPEPPPPGSPLYTLPNVVLTPHIAGSMFAECRRMGRYMVEELERYVAGQPLRWAITREMNAIMA